MRVQSYDIVMMTKLKMMKPLRDSPSGAFLMEARMKNRQRQRENRIRYKIDPRKYASGGTDMTAYKAIRNVTRQEKREKRNGEKA